jgi:hypothetical protein
MQRKKRKKRGDEYFEVEEVEEKLMKWEENNVR